jgi:tetratricopeptide (TPR) repeat protein/tRNA A-37 threonylcarbamoyl transferase component Bud32/TolB-like protein
MSSRPISGQMLGHYRLLERIGEGGMGVVYRARDEHLQREVALKVLPPSVVSDESARRRFKKEALTLARLNHPNVGILHGYETDGDVDFLVMEYVHGVTLASKLARGPQRESELLENAVQLTSALEEAHRQGVIHRDLKPSNILITANGQLKILDFGLARFLNAEGQSDTATDTLTIAGTLPYVAPEQLSGSKEADSRSDVYSCGVVLYEMATGRRPHNETSVASLLAAILNREPPPVRSLNPAISPDLESIIRKAMDKDPALRYQTASELKVDLQRLVSGKRLEIVSTPPRSVRRQWLTRLLAVALLLLIAIEVATFRWKAHTPGSLAAATPRVLAVLPFDAVGGNRDNQVLCRGLTDLLTTRLTQISKQYDVEVVPASEVRNQGVSSVRDARQKLGVSLVVEGSWDFVGDQVMYSLVNAESQRGLDAQSLRADVGDVFSVEREVSDGLLKMVAGELRPGPNNMTVSASAAHPDAYQYYVRGVGYLQEYQDLSSLQSAVTLFRTALDRDPSFAPAMAGAGEAYWRLYQETKDATWIPKALDVCRRAAELNDNLAAVHTTLGMIYQGESRYDAAVKEFERALTLDSTSDGAYRGLASSYEALGKDSEAEAAYKQAITARKDYWGGYSALGAFYAKHAHYEDAAIEFRKVIELAPENVRGYTNLGAVYVYQGKLKDAEDELQKSLAIEPNYRGYSNLGTLYFSQGKYTGAAQMFEKALQLNGRDGRVWRNLGDAYYWAPGEREKAAGAYNHAIELLAAQRNINPKDPALMVELALCDVMIGKSSDAIDLIRQARKRSPSDPNTLYRAAQVYEQTGNRAAAMDALRQAVGKGYSTADIQLDPTFQGLHDDPRFKQLIQQGLKQHRN